ncbi:MAG TPA: hypothetical protein VK781_02820 [Solirubrobacteraceae bacterium]|nr:hypothetical protein [Solirubrobacteraceae bacterium]
MRHRWKGTVAAAGVLLALVVLATAAFAAGQVESGSYTGALVPSRDGVVVSFKVSGKRVTGLSTSNVPLYCSGGGRPTPVHFKNATISSKGTFSSNGRYIIQEGPKKGQVGSKLKIDGRFLKGGAVKGTLTTTYLGFPNCSGKSPYTAKV